MEQGSDQTFSKLSPLPFPRVPSVFGNLQWFPVDAAGCRGPVQAQRVQGKWKNDRTVWSPGLYSNNMKDICANHSWVELLDETLALEKSLEVLLVPLVGPVPSHACKHVHTHTCTILFLDLVPNPELIPCSLRRVMSLLPSYFSPCSKWSKCYSSTLCGVLWEPPQKQLLVMFSEGAWLVWALEATNGASC